jgi:hypothetical protein
VASIETPWFRTEQEIQSVQAFQLLEEEEEKEEKEEEEECLEVVAEAATGRRQRPAPSQQSRQCKAVVAMPLGRASI